MKVTVVFNIVTDSDVSARLAVQRLFGSLSLPNTINIVEVSTASDCRCASPTYGRIGTDQFFCCQHCGGHIDG